MNRHYKEYEAVFIVGCQRTGTTLSGNILGAHPHAFLIDETDGLYPWIETVFTNHDLNKASTLFRKCCQSARNNYAHPDHKCDSNGNLSANITHLILKSPNLTYSADQIAWHFPKPICIFTYRDIRDVVVSMNKLDRIPMCRNQLKRIKGNASIATRFKSVITTLEDPETQAHQARAHIVKIKTDLRDTFDQPNIRKLEIGYENLVRNPTEWRDKMLTHLGLPTNIEALDHTKVMTGTGPGFNCRQRKINTDSVGQWKLHLSPEQEGDIWEVSESTMLSLGYSRNPDNTPPISLWKNIDSKFKHSPVVATGRGGSGTRLLSILLQSLGIFAGNKISLTEDSLEWEKSILEIASERTQLKSELPVGQWDYMLQETAAKILSKGNWDGLHLWGWKLPETMLVLPDIFNSFKNAKLIQLVRHPVDTCLRRTHLTSRVENPVGLAVLKVAYNNLGWNQERIFSDPDYLRNAASWLYQVSEATRFGRDILEDDWYFEMRYEDICTNPSSAQQSLADFLQIDSNTRALKIDIDPLRQRNWNYPDARADEIWDICGEVAEQFGYKASESFDG